MSFDLTFTRNDTALVRRASGNYVRAVANEPTLTYNTDGSWLGYRVPRTFTNIYKNFDPSSGGTNMTYAANDWGIGTAFANKAIFDNLGGAVNAIRYDSDTTPASSSWATFGFFARSTDGAKPNVGRVSTSQLRLIYGGAPVSIVVISETSLANNVWYFCVQAQAPVSPSTAVGFQQNTSYTGGVPVEVSGVTIVEGQVTIGLFDGVITTGAAATRVLSDARNTTIPSLQSFGLLMKVRLEADGAIRVYAMLGTNNDNFLRLRKTDADRLNVTYQVASAAVFNITSEVLTSGDYAMYFGAEAGKNYFYVNGVKIGDNTIAFSALGTILAIGRNITGTGNIPEAQTIKEFLIDSTPSEARAVEMTTP